MDIPHTIIRRSVVLQRISKPEINRPKTCKNFSYQPNMFKAGRTSIKMNKNRAE